MDYFEVYSLVFLDTALELCLFYINLCFLSEFQAKTLPCSTREQSLQYKVIPGTRMLSRQSTLPKLPVPPLEQTLQKFLRSVKPLNSPEDFRNAEKVRVCSSFSKLCLKCTVTCLQLVKEFGRPGGEGEKLQKLLQTRADKTTNWVSVADRRLLGDF